MEAFKLIGMADFVLEQKETDTFDLPQIMWYDKEVEKLMKIRNYAKFLKQPLTLCMFIPTDEEGNILEEPSYYVEFLKNKIASDKLKDNCLKYQQAQERVKFEGFISNDTGCAILQQSPNALVIDMTFYKGRTVEYILNSKCTLTLTQSAVKQLGI